MNLTRYRNREIGSRPDPARMTFLEHLGELRVRLLRSIYGVFLGTVVALTWSNELFIALQQPFLAHFSGAELIGTGPAEAFITKLKIAIAVGFCLALPWVFTQVWLFILPGLEPHERKFALPFIGSATLFFVAGATFCYSVVIPFAFEFFAESFSVVGLNAQIRISEYLSFTVGLLLIFGVMFEMPLLSYILARLGVLSAAFLTRNFRYAVVIIFITAAILTPPDVITQTLLAIPLCLLYGVSIYVARLGEKAAGTRSHENTTAKSAENAY